ncbi:MAG TPA: NAD(P)-binding protein, partial [Fimbriimonas sp.]|nr:NAD(P)-binding protein [Fimbriimonas sp.]
MGHVVVCGLGQVGYRVSSLLLRLGREVTVVTSEARQSFVEDLTARGAQIVFMDARDTTALQRADVNSAEALIACTSSDLTNIEIALDARSIAPKLRIVARIFDQTLGEQLRDSMGIDLCLAMSTIAAPRFAAEALEDHVIGHFDHAGTSYSVQLGATGDIPIEPNQFISVKPNRNAFERHRIRRAGKLATILKEIPRSLLYMSVAILLLAIISTAVFSYAMKLPM